MDQRDLGKEGVLRTSLRIRSANACAGVTSVGLSRTSLMTSPSPLVLMTQVTDPTVKDWPGLGANGELGKRTIWPAMGSSAHPYLACQLSTKDARQSIEGATRDGKLIGEVSKIRSKMVTETQD